MRERGLILLRITGTRTRESKYLCYYSVASVFADIAQPDMAPRPTAATVWVLNASWPGFAKGIPCASVACIRDLLDAVHPNQGSKLAHTLKLGPSTFRLTLLPKPLLLIHD